MAIETKSDLISRTFELLVRLDTARNESKGLNPSQQLDHTSNLLDDAGLFDRLQDKVRAIFQREQGAITGLSDDEFGTISQKLLDVSDIFDEIESNSVIATELIDLANEIQKVFSEAGSQNVSPEKISSLQGRISKITSNPKINVGNQNASHGLKEMIASYQQLAPHRVHAAPAPVQNRDIIAEQDAAFESDEAVGFLNTLSRINTSLQKLPIEDFNTVLGFYTSLKIAYSKKTHFIRPDNKELMEKVLRNAERIMGDLIHDQVVIEEAQANASLGGLRLGERQATNSEALFGLKIVMDFACSEVLKPNVDRKVIEQSVQEAFSKISQEDREKLLEAVGIVLVQEGKAKKPLSPTLLGQPFAVWTTSFEFRKQALELVFSSLTPVVVAPIAAPVLGSPAVMNLKNQLASAWNSTNAPGFNGEVAGTNVKNVQEAFSKLSDEEKKELFKALSDVLIAEKQRSTPLPNSIFNLQFQVWCSSYPYRLKAVEKMLASAAPQTQAPVAAPAVKKPSAEMLSALFAIQAQFPAQQTPPTKNPGIRQQTTPGNRSSPPSGVATNDGGNLTHAGIKALQKMIPLLGTGSSLNNLQDALEMMMILESVGHRVSFKISGNIPSLIGDRPCFHLYYIHKNETPEKLIDDMQYGNKAMAGFYPAHNEERCRAIQRTLVELSLEALEDAVSFNTAPDIMWLMGILGEMWPRMHPKDVPQDLLAFLDSLFSGDSPDNGLEGQIRAINSLRERLKQTWKL